MSVLRFTGIDDAVANEVRQTLRAPHYGHPAHREIARGYGPCRSCLRTFAIAEDERILFTYQPFHDPGSLPAPGPVFIHVEECRRYDDTSFPPDLRSLPLVFEAYQNGGRLVAQERIGARDPDDVLHRLFDQNVDYVHIRNGEAGCFMARVQRQ